MPKLEKLTPGQESLMPVVRQEWLDRLFKCELRTDREEARKGLEWVYEKSGLKKPFVLFVDSPAACQFSANLLTSKKFKEEIKELTNGAQVWAQVGAQVRAQVKAQVGDQVGDQVRAQVWAQVGAQVKAQVWDQVWAQVGAQVWAQVGAQVWDQVRAQVKAQVWDQVRAQVKAQVGAQVKAQVGAQVKAQVWDQKMEFFSNGWYLDITDFGWNAFYDYFDRIGMKITEDFKKFRKLIKSGIFYTIQLDGLCIVSDMPSKLTRDEKNNLHNAEGHAIEFRDGYGQHYLWGVAFKPEEWKKYRNADVKTILSCPNIDQRQTLMKLRRQEIGNETFDEHIFQEIGGTLIDKSEVTGNELYEVSVVQGQKDKMARYVCPSTSRVYMSFVPRDIQKADAALAWKHHGTIEDYLNCQLQA